MRDRKNKQEIAKKNTYLAKTNVFVRNENNRIVFYRIDSGEQMDWWDNHWTTTTPEYLNSFYAPYKNGFIGRGTLPRILIKHLPKTGIILEGGCGMAQYVMA